jgi:hypothetical protein
LYEEYFVKKNIEKSFICAEIWPFEVDIIFYPFLIYFQKPAKNREQLGFIRAFLKAGILRYFLQKELLKKRATSRRYDFLKNYDLFQHQMGKRGGIPFHSMDSLSNWGTSSNKDTSSNDDISSDGQFIQ